MKMNEFRLIKIQRKFVATFRINNILALVRYTQPFRFISSPFSQITVKLYRIHWKVPDAVISTPRPAEGI